MLENTLRDLEVFCYASTQVASASNWDRTAIGRIETQILLNKSLDRLHALIYKHAIARNQLHWFTAETQRILKTNTTKLIVDNAAKTQFIKQLVPLFESSNISIILLKGMAFNGNIYSDDGPRGVSDIDILILPSDKEKFNNMFSNVATLIKQEKKYAFDELYEQTWRVEKGLHLVDVHTSLTNPILFNIEMTSLWNNSISHPKYGSKHIRILNPEFTLLHLTTHVINDTNFLHYNLIDAHEIITRQEINRDLLLKFAKGWGLANALPYLLTCCECYLKSPAVLVEISQKRLKKLKSKLVWIVIKELFPLSSTEKSLLHRFKQITCYLIFVNKPILYFIYVFLVEKYKNIFYLKLFFKRKK
jgi:hypothetical protein